MFEHSLVLKSYWEELFDNKTNPRDSKRAFTYLHTHSLLVTSNTGIKIIEKAFSCKTLWGRYGDSDMILKHKFARMVIYHIEEGQI